ncbi:MAG: hypothetical protein VYC39_17880 [Myxococcota bacterium]|nr:hypothetical protein [Myxococcota bacterium]
MHRHRKLLVTLLLSSAFGCDEFLAPQASTEVILGVDISFRETGIAEAFRAGFEQASHKRLQFSYREPEILAKALRDGQLEAVLTSRAVWSDQTLVEGIVSKEEAIAHEEFVFIGPAEDKFRSHGSKGPVEFLQNVIRSNYLYLVARPSSFEQEAHARLERKTGNRPGSGSQIETTLSGTAFVKEVVRRNAFGLVRRSSLVLAASEGIKPHRVYQQGEPQLVLPVRILFAHPARAKQGHALLIQEYLVSGQWRSILEKLGASRVGLPFYSLGMPKAGAGARAPSP